VDSASIGFVLFGLTAAIVSNVSSSQFWRSTVLLGTSVIFLGLLAQSPLSLLPLAAFLLLGYTGLALLERGWSRSWVWSIMAVILAFLWLKKYTFLPEGIFLRYPYFTLGISYIFFRVLHLLIESSDESEKRPTGLVAYLCYTLNFTTLVSGPIQRFDEFVRDQFTNKPIALGPRLIGDQLERIARGLFKVNVLALLLDMVHADALAQLSQPVPVLHKLFAAFCLTVAYPLFLYANFSGYIDIVIALGRLLRLRLPENFDRPFSAASFLEFWSRWHITLSTWLKTYVYNPLLLTLMRRIPSLELQPLLGIISFFVTFFLVGIWHGRTSEFAIFGVLQGGGVAINKLWQVALAQGMGRKAYKALAANQLYVVVARGLTFTWFAFTLFFFWASWEQMEATFFRLSLGNWIAVWLGVFLCSSVLLATWEWLRAQLISMPLVNDIAIRSRYARVIYATALALVTFVMITVLEQPAPDIVYKAF
jgi:D-alanyl-lipoteichoic acid acyltransferase DltB (MBOAT superfamily)